MLSSEKTGNLAIIVASILWGTTGTAASFTSDVSPLATGAFAMGFAALLLLIHARQALLQQRALLRQFLPWILIGAVAVFVYPLAFYSAMRYAGVATGTLISIAGAPLAAILIECLFGTATFTRRWMLSFACGGSGVALLLLNKDPVVMADNTSLGVWLGVIAAISYACYTYTSRQLVLRGVSSRAAMASQFGIAACMLLPSLWWTGEHLFTGFTNTAVAFYMALVPMFLGYLCFGYGLNYVSAGRATLMTMLEPAVATLLAVLIVGESFNLAGWGGIALVALCLFFQFQPDAQLNPQANVASPRS